AFPEGEQLAAATSRHFSEVRRLINSNRRIATMWHRAGGPGLLRRLLAGAIDTEVPMLIAREFSVPSGATPRPMKMDDSLFEGGEGGCPSGIGRRHPPQPKGLPPPQGGFSREVEYQYLRRCFDLVARYGSPRLRGSLG